MSKLLKIKDPIFGYILIDDDDLYNVVNSAMFQRLRDIVQTSYPSVYPSAVHNRFVHSLGVYHLGYIAQDTLKKDVCNKFPSIDVENLCKTFLLACLMHDIGHSPFSHTGEHFYFDDLKPEPNLWQMLLNELNDEQINNDVKGKERVGAEHEIMSAYVSLIYFPDIFRKYDKGFFTRCIIGLKYPNPNDVRNCFIDLLNSKTIDVDKLDYLIRDSFVTGFKSINIDYYRLLKAVCIIKKDNNINLGFDKSALSTLESVILAHDMEKKWIQNHPVIKYEGNLVSYMISKARDYFESKKLSLFSADALSEKGAIGDEGVRICLLSDSDINSFAKTLYGQDQWITEYYAREKRKKTLWKSEAEYRTYFDVSGVTNKVLSLLESRFEALEDMLTRKFYFPVINEETLNFLNQEVADTSIPANIFKGKKEELLKAIGLIQVIKTYANTNKIPFEFVISSGKQFKTGFNKNEFKKIDIRFDNNNTKPLDSILYLFEAEEPREKFFYLFANAREKAKIDVAELANKLILFMLREYQKEERQN